MSTDLDNEFCRTAADALEATFWGSTVPLFVYVDGAAVLEGTGVLLRIGGMSFIVSAAHVFLKAKNQGRSIHVAHRVPEPGLFEVLRNFRRFSVNRADSRDHLDVAVQELDTQETDLLREYRFVEPVDLDTQERPGDDLYCVAGYSADMSSRNLPLQPVIEAARLFGFARPYAGPPIEFPGYDPRYHLLLEGRRRGAVPIVGDSPLPRTLTGLSGGGIWKMNLDRVPADQWQPADAKLVAIQTCASSDAIRGTVFKAVTTLIARSYPTLGHLFTPA